ncbi:MAG: T9SS type A sorting domain-containing protein [Bacteroidetes bacterium]|nr:T9SS type A sorting domain-containing protein [Bacteroidota bacterium]
MKANSKRLAGMLALVVWGLSMQTQAQSSISFATPIANCNASCIATDVDTVKKNFYFIGMLEGSADFDPSSKKKTLTGNGNYEPMDGVELGTPIVASYKETATGVALNWAKTIKPIANGSYIYLSDVVFDYATSSICVTGSFYGKIKTDATVLTSLSDGVNVFFIKYSASGTVLKSAVLKSVSSSDYPALEVQETITDKNGNLYILGNYFGGDVYFNPSPYNSNSITFPTGENGEKDYFLAKYDKNFKLMWAKPIRTNENEIDIKMDVDKGGNNILLSGFYKVDTTKLSIDFNTKDAYQYYLKGKDGAYNSFFAKYFSSNGNLQFAKRIEGAPWGNAKFDNVGNIVFIGNVEKNKPVYLVPDNNLTTKVVATTDTAFIARYNGIGAFQWSALIMGNGRFTIDSKNNTIISSYNSVKKMYNIYKYTSMAVLKWKTTFKPTVQNAGYANIVSSAPVACFGNTLYFTGNFYGGYTLVASSTSKKLTTSGGWFVAKYKLSGTALSPEDQIEENNSNTYKMNATTSSMNVSIYPNPATDVLTLKTTLTGNAVITIYNYNGVAVKTVQATEQETKLNISELPAGIYFVEMVGNGNKEVNKIIKN